MCSITIFSVFVFSIYPYDRIRCFLIDFIAYFLPVGKCSTSITFPKEPLPIILIILKSSRLVPYVDSSDSECHIKDFDGLRNISFDSSASSLAVSTGS